MTKYLAHFPLYLPFWEASGSERGNTVAGAILWLREERCNSPGVVFEGFHLRKRRSACAALHGLGTPLTR